MRGALAFGLVLGVVNSVAILAVSEPQLVADLATIPSPTDGSKPHAFATLGGDVVLAAQPGDHADRLFRSNGTASGTEEIADPCGFLENGTVELRFATVTRAYFSVRCSYTAEALWMTDGTPAGTYALLGEGDYHSVLPFFPAPSWVEEGSSVLFLQGGDYVSPLELWRTDGTVVGTSRLAVLAGESGATGGLSRRADGDFLLLVSENFGRLSVWKSDGTPAGTEEVTALTFGSQTFSAQSFAGTQGGITFMVWVSDPGRIELWHADGTAAGTVRLAEFDVGFRPGLVAHEGSVYFAASTGGASGIWRSDGTSATTRRIVALDGREISPSSFNFLDERIYSIAVEDDGSSGVLLRAPLTGGEAEEIVEICAGGSCEPDSEDLWIRSLGGALVYAKREGGVSTVWRSGADGAGATRVAALCAPEDCFGMGVGPVVLDGRLFFASVASAGVSRELWTTDGTPGGTMRLAGPLPVLPWVGSSAATPLAAVPGRGGWLFAAGETEHGLELWYAGLQPDSGVLVSDLRLDRPGLVGLESVGIVDATHVFALRNTDAATRTHFRSPIGGGPVEPFLTVPVHHGRHGIVNPPPSLRPAGSAWFFFESDLGEEGEFAQQVWRYDPESRDLKALFSDPETTGIGAIEHDLFPSGSDNLFLGSRDAALQPAIYRLRPPSGKVSKLIDLPASSAKSLGRSGDTWFLVEDGERVVVFDLGRRTRVVLADFAGGYIDQLVVLSAGALFEVVWRNSASIPRVELWQSDGTAAGTREVAEWPDASDCGWSAWLPPKNSPSAAIFSVQSSCGPLAELWISDGSAERTRLLRSFPGEVLSIANGGSSWHGDRYSLASSYDVPTASQTFTIWRTNGTSEGTLAVALLPSDGEANSEQWLSGATGAEAIYFPWSDSDHGVELWRTDGTAAGTGLLADLEPGSQGSLPSNLRTVGDQVLFTAWNALYGTELWQVDGGLVTPELVADLYPGPESSSPVVLDGNDEVLFIQADDGLVGREIWEVDRPSVAPCVSSATTLCLANGRFRARAVRRDFAGQMGEAGVVPLTGDSGYFWFFAPGNPEVVLKIVDACGLLGFENFWAFSTGLTNVEVELEIVDTWSGERKTVRTALGEAYGPLFDSGSFRVCASEGVLAPPPTANEPAPMPSSSVLPLLEGRFEATATWKKLDGTTGDGQAVPIAADSGYFWFFAPSIAEVLVKMVDACGYPGFDNYWVFAGGLTDVEVHLTVRDTMTGETVTRDNAQGHPFASLLETGSLENCNADP